MHYDLFGFALSPRHYGENVIAELDGGSVAGRLVAARTQWIGHGSWETWIRLDVDGTARWHKMQRWGRVRFVDRARGPGQGSDAVPLGQR